MKSTGFAQDLEKIEDFRKVEVHGGLSATSTFYDVKGLENRRDPFFWMLQGNLNFQIGMINIPFSASISTQTKSFTHPKPFNHVGISPKYKAFTAHLGYRSMQFSEFTLAGQQFLGAGVEYNPSGSPLRAQAMYGQFQKAGAERSYTGIPLYERWGGGVKVGYASDSGRYDLILFKAQDDKLSLADTTAEQYDVKPADNLVLGATVQQELMGKFNVNLEYALSAYTSDTRMPELVLEKYSYINNFGKLYQPRASSRVSSAFLSSVDVSFEPVNVNISYRRVSPDYVSMGSPYATNDFEDITAGVSFPVKEKIHVSVQGGLQRNDLKNERLERTKRAIGSLSLSYQPSARLNLNGAFSNYSSDTQMAEFVQSSTGVDPDTIFFRQVNTSSSLNINYSMPGERVQKGIMFSASMQETSDNKNTSSRFYNINSGVNWQHVSSNTLVNLSYNINNNQMTDTETVSQGPVATISKGFFKNKLRGSLNLIDQVNKSDGAKSGAIKAARLNISCPFAKKQTITLNSSLTTRKTFQQENKNFREFRGTIMYRIAF